MKALTFILLTVVISDPTSSTDVDQTDPSAARLIRPQVEKSFEEASSSTNSVSISYWNLPLALTYALKSPFLHLFVWETQLI